MEYWSNGKTLGKQSKIFSYALPTLQCSNTPSLQFFGTPTLQLPRSDDEGYMLRTEFAIGRKTVHVPSYDHY